ncbi:MAG TPA: CotH kinase family protein [Nitrospira sp.]|nr:CotH kinase family protein [Nitrospira sp.]
MQNAWLSGMVRTRVSPREVPQMPASIEHLSPTTHHKGAVWVACFFCFLTACGGDDSAPVASSPSNPNSSQNAAIAAACVAQRPASLSITTAGMVPITSREDYVNATLNLNGQALATRIRGRGNSTWQMPKKPYRLNLNEATSLLGMPAARNWALLANYADKTLLRNALAFCVSETLEMEYTPKSRFVELTLNGQYDGVYQLTEHVEVAPHKVNIGPETETSNGFFIEHDGMFAQEPAWFISSMELPFVFKSDPTPQQMIAIEQYVNDVERRLSTDFASFAERVDIGSFVNLYLVNELLKNNDAFHFSSTFFFRRQDERLRFGPAWDFDIAAGNIDRNGNDDPTGFWTREQVYPRAAFRYPEFEQRVKDRWRFLESRGSAMLDAISASARALEDSQRRNFERWDILDIAVPPNPVVTGSYEGEIDYLRNWLRTRINWLDAQFGMP